MKIEGNTDTIPLRELIEMIMYSSVTGSLNLCGNQRGMGHLYFRDGCLYHCDFAGESGVEALMGLFELSQASFCFASDLTCDQESLWGDTDYHVRTAERLATRWQRIRAVLPSLDMTPTLRVPLDTALRRVGPSQHALLNRIDGEHSLREIVEELGWVAIDVAEALAQMHAEQLIDLRPAAQPLVMPTAGAARGGLFKRLTSRSGEAPHQAAEQHLNAEELVLQVLRS